MLEDRRNRVKWVYSSGGDDSELEKRYDQWAGLYDEDINEHFGYILPDRVSEIVANWLPGKAVKILDAGAGTGLVGQSLYALGFTDLMAIDLSEGMPEEARNKGVYRDVLKMILGKPLSFETDSFDGVVCVGTFTLGHAPAESLDEFIRITKPGGYIFFTIRPDVYEDEGFKEKQSTLEALKYWEQVLITEDFQSLPKGEPDAHVRVYVYKAL